MKTEQLAKYILSRLQYVKALTHLKDFKFNVRELVGCVEEIEDAVDRKVFTFGNYPDLKFLWVRKSHMKDETIFIMKTLSDKDYLAFSKLPVDIDTLMQRINMCLPDEDMGRQLALGYVMFHTDYMERFNARTPHLMLHPSLQGKGIVNALIGSWLKSGRSLISHAQTKDAEHVWTKAVQSAGTYIVFVALDELNKTMYWSEKNFESSKFDTYQVLLGKGRKVTDLPKKSFNVTHI